MLLGFLAAVKWVEKWGSAAIPGSPPGNPELGPHCPFLLRFTKQAWVQRNRRVSSEWNEAK